MAIKRKLDETLVNYFSKIKAIKIDYRQTVKDQYIELWNSVIEGTSLDENCVYSANDQECTFVIASALIQYQTLTYPYKTVHNGDDPMDICWDIILYDALTYIKKNKLITKRNVHS